MFQIRVNRAEMKRLLVDAAMMKPLRIDVATMKSLRVACALAFALGFAWIASADSTEVEEPASADSTEVAESASADSTEVAESASADSTEVAELASANSTEVSEPASADSTEVAEPASADSTEVAELASANSTEVAAMILSDDAMPRGPSVADRLAIIREKIQNALEYPPLAQLLDSDGDALVRFEIDHSGTAQNIRVVQSSGHDRLDTSAIRAVEAASPLPWVYGPLEVPVHFELTTSR